MSQDLTIEIHADSYQYSTQTRVIPASGSVVFHNQLQQAIYLMPSDNQPCPFSETWPQCIPAGQKVVRQLLTPLYQKGKFKFHYQLMPGASSKVITGDLTRPQDPQNDGEVIVE